MKKYERKNVPFDLTKEDEKALYEWLQTLKHGQFSEETKMYWRKKMGLGAEYRPKMKKGGENP